MSRVLKRLMLAVLVTAGIAAGYRSIQDSTASLDSLLAFCAADNGNSIVSWYDSGQIVVASVGPGGKAGKTVRFSAETKGSMYNMVGMASGGSYVYVLRNRVDRYDGDLQGQELMVIDFGGLWGKTEKIFELTCEDGYEYGWLNASGDTITLIASDEYGTAAVRESYEFGAVLENTLNLKNTRTYPLETGEGVYKAMANSTDLVYISDSGKIYRADEQSVQEVYPARTLETLMYPTWIAYAESGYIYLEEHETGNVIRLNLENGEEETVLSGSSPFAGSSLYTPRDVVSMSMSNLNTFTALIKDPSDGGFLLLVSQEGSVHAIRTVKYGGLTVTGEFLRNWIVTAAAGELLVGLLALFMFSIRGGHTIMERLVSATIPLLALTMALFGWISFQYYKGAIEDNFVKQVVDEGNMLSALFGQESFNEIEYPYDYSGEAYSYLSQQLATRDLYSRVVYYENGDLYIGVDAHSPCFYPFDILMNAGIEDLYRRAALTGEAVTGTIRDQLGERMVCITPVGGLSGDTVYLLESGVYTANIASYTGTFVKDFVIVCAAFLVIVMVALLVLFYNILAPIGEIKRNMQLFADGDRSIRIHMASEDELTGIAQVFNKMADDIDVQILNLQRMSETYYRFVPPSIISRLGQNNLGSLTLGSNVRGDFPVLNVRVYLEDALDMERNERLVNRFFNTVNRFGQQGGIISIVDDANLQSMMLICQNGVESAIVTALTILARIDADNKLYEEREQLHVVFVLDQTDVYFGICGDDDRYIPVVLAPEFEKLLSHGPFLREMGSRFLMTAAAYRNAAGIGSYAHRYIGCLKTEDMDLGLYDIYDDRSADQIRVMKQTQHVFDKAMDLYEKGYYYEAKNMYAMILRENPRDMAARYYIFRCEELQKTK